MQGTERGVKRVVCADNLVVNAHIKTHGLLIGMVKLRYSSESPDVWSLSVQSPETNVVRLHSCGHGSAVVGSVRAV